MDRFVTTLVSLSLMVLAFIVSVQAAEMATSNDIEGQGGGNYGGTQDFF